MQTIGTDLQRREPGVGRSERRRHEMLYCCKPLVVLSFGQRVRQFESLFPGFGENSSQSTVL